MSVRCAPPKSALRCRTHNRRMQVSKDAADKLVSGAAWSRDEAAAGFNTLGHAIDALGRERASRS